MEESAQAKVVLLGDSGVGKSSILDQFILQEFKSTIESTLGASFKTKEVDLDSKKIRLNIWDTAGQEKYASLAKMYCRGANAAILVYDITKKDTFDNLKHWLTLLAEIESKHIIVAIVGNKEDLVENEAVDINEARKFAVKIGALYKKTSAKENVGIEELFRSIAASIFPDSQSSRKPSFKIDQVSQENRSKKSCCS